MHYLIEPYFGKWVFLEPTFSFSSEELLLFVIGPLQAKTSQIIIKQLVGTS